MSAALAWLFELPLWALALVAVFWIAARVLIDRRLARG